MKHLLTCLVLLACSTISLSAQVYTPPPCMPHYGSVSYPIATIQQTPPLQTGMPLEVLWAYIGYDSLLAGVIYDELQAFTQTVTWDDTLQYAMKYFYHLVDYDPVLYELYCAWLYPTRERFLLPDEIYSALKKAVKRVSPNAYLDALLLRSKVIAHVRVDEIVIQTDTSAHRAPTAHVATSTIIEPIKGQRIIPCVFNPPNTKESNDVIQEAELPSAEPGACLQFDFRSEWMDSATDSEGFPWLEQGREYIVFLDIHNHCTVDDQTYYMSMYPISSGTRCSMYPIINGVVHDAGDDLGFGTHLPLADFKAALNTHVTNLLNP